MEEPFNKEDASIRKWIKETPLERPSPDFMQKVMRGVERSVAKKEYQPLIPPKAWFVIIILFVAGVSWIYINPSSSLIDLGTSTWKDQISVKNPFESLKVSRTMLYAIGFMALFLFQIPILKRIIDKNYG